MSTLKSNVIEPATGTNLTLAASGDVIDVASDSIKLNTWKDAGGNTLFTSDGSGTWSGIDSALTLGGGPTLIQSQTVSSDTASISFTTGLDNTDYDKYMFVMTNIRAANDDRQWTFNTSPNSGTSYAMTKTSTYFTAHHYESGGSTGLGIDTSGLLRKSTAYQPLGVSMGNDADQNYSGILHLFRPWSSTTVHHWQCQGNLSATVNYSQNVFCSGYIFDQDAINAIQFKYHSGDIANATIKMYGCR